ncbi:MAG: thioredoxin domain-containing protein [Chitinophagaceae bacterium]
MMQHTNRLINETSPYLLQHAHNPVDWYPWGDEALQRAKEENKPILISIGYSSCHWCHVMERESFEEASTAALMNRHFINIKIDREERPDLDHIYMDAVQAMTGSGGWPLNVFLTPDLKPFYGGTYFPPLRAYNRASWKEVLHGVADAFQNRREEIEEQANNLVAHLANSNSFGSALLDNNLVPAHELFQSSMLDDKFVNIMKTADKEWGGFGRAPKFPQTFVIRFLLQYYNSSGNKEALDQACLSLDKMIMGGIYDHVGGGLARYSTDAEWLVPHFEKMLYDNALLLMALSDAYKITNKEEYKIAIQETIAFVEREMLSPEDGFYSALDADSEGVEGKYYTWQEEEVRRVLGSEANLFCNYYNITAQGNWEETNILWVKKTKQQFCSENKIDIEWFEEWRKENLEKLYQVRSVRIRPLLDDKIILGWNALMNQALCMAFEATAQECYRELAKRNMKFLLSSFKNDKGQFHHTYKNGEARFNAYLDDLSFLIHALIALQEITSDLTYLLEAERTAQFVTDLFADNDSPFLFFTQENSEHLVVRKKEVYDGALPSGNAEMAHVYNYLGIIFARSEWVNKSVQMLGALKDAVVRYPSSFGNWGLLLANQVQGFFEIAVTGQDYQKGRDEVLKLYLPNKVMQSARSGNDQFPLLEGKGEDGPLLFYLCKQYACGLPAENMDDFKEILKSQRK